MKNYTVFFYNNDTHSGDEFKIQFEAENQWKAQTIAMDYENKNTNWEFCGVYETELGMENRIF